MPDFLLPDLGEGLDEAEVIAWRVQTGDHVTVDQVIAEVETAKAVVELPVPYAGVVTALHAEPGSTVSVGQPLITVTADDPATGFREPGVVVPGQAPAADAVADGGEASGSVLVGYGTTATAARRRRGRRRAAGGAPPASAPPARVAVISPLVRKQARDAGLDLAGLTGTGPAGVVSRQDVRRAIAERAERQQPAVPAAPDAGIEALADSTERRIPLRGARRATAEHVTRSRREIPEATVWVDVDATALVEARRKLNTRDSARPVSLLALLARFAVLGLRRYPELNARVERDEIVVPGHVHLGFAAQTEHGLIVPVVHDAHLLSTRDLSDRLAERTAAARERRLSPADLAGGTFTVNNYGVFGVDGSAAIINHPEVAILGMGRVIDRPWAVDGQLAVRKVAELTLAFDHRACDGGTAGGFLRYVADCVESPVAAMGDM
ncbi:MAG TPA: dihydrolipoamide acetyltransferase family protein [Streptosporangiaceae bacterium]|nr:dihydrolipoamide acetyltransferase family protein [Streptosporangiaceae bacterium]